MQVFKKIISLAVAAVCCYGSFAQKKAHHSGELFTVTGKVVDAVSGKPLRGVRLSYRSLSANITDSAGNFALKVPATNVVVLAEADGYQLKEIAVRGEDKLVIRLYEDGFTSFTDDINLPQGKQTKTLSPYAVTGISVNDAWGHSNQNPDSYLQGKVAGLNAIRRSGTPNIGATLMLRGINSLYASNQPLVVVDGVIFNNSDPGGSIISNHYTNPLSTIDIRDIDNFTVIKDASSIYGTKGANGAIIITTARANQLGTKIDFAVTGGVNLAPENTPVLKAADYRIYLSELLKTSGMSVADIQAQPYMNDDPSNPEYFKYHNETDWQKLALKRSASQNIYLKVTGGDNIAKYALSLGYLSNKGITSNTDLTRYNMRFNGDLNLSRRMTAVTNLSFEFSEQNLRDQGFASKTNPLFLALVKSPFLRTNDVASTGKESPTLADRDTFNISNPMAIINLGQGLNKNYRFLGNIGFVYEITDDLDLSSNVGVTYDKVRENFFVPRKGTTTDTLSNAIAFNRMGSQVKSLFSLFNDTKLSYSKTFGGVHAFAAKLGMRYLYDKTERDFGLGYNSAVDELVSVGNGVNALRRIGGEIGQSRWLNSYLNIDYNFSDRYIVSLNAAMDGSSRFGKDGPGGISLSGNKYAFMPSVAAAWMISSENFMKGSRIDLLKLRGSYSIAGNDDIGNYTSQQTYVSQNLLGIQGLVRAGIGNNELQWEQVKKFNAGLDAALLHERLSLSIDIYNNKSDKVITYEKAPSATGFDYVITNSAALATKGLEASLNYRILNKRNLKLDAGVMIGKYTSSVSTLPGDPIISTFGDASYITMVGGSPNAYYGFKTNGVYATDADAAAAGLFVRKANGTLVPFTGGDIKFTDLNGDKVIDDNDRMQIGDPNPDFFGSFYQNISWKRFSLNTLFTFSSGNDIYNYTRSQLESMEGPYNQTEAVLNRWRTNGQQTAIPKATWGDPMGNSRFSDRWIEDGSYLRLKTLTVTYNVPIKPGFFKYATVYATGNNLLTFTKYKGYDPEFSATESIFGQGVDNTLEPQFRSVQLGFKIGL